MSCKLEILKGINTELVKAGFKKKEGVTELVSLINNTIESLEYKPTKKKVTKKTQRTKAKPNTPEFDKLPGYVDGQKTMVYAGIGSRSTPPELLAKMREIAAKLEGKGYTLRTGDAPGADKAFRESVDMRNMEVYTPNDATDLTKKIAREIHKNKRLKDGFGLNAHARNANQVFGKNLDTPVDFVLAYTPLNEKGEVVTHANQRFYGGRRDHKNNTGGTGQAIAYASLKGIPVINMADPDWENQLNAIVGDSKKSTTTKGTKTDYKIDSDAVMYSSSSGATWLSNFQKLQNPITNGDEKYYSVEAYFQAMKTENVEERKQFQDKNLSGKAAKELGKKVTLRKDWDSMRNDVMARGQKQKFLNNKWLKTKLLETGNRQLVESAPWEKSNSYWGVAKDGTGKNKSGEIVMEVRSSIVGETKDTSPKEATSTPDTAKAELLNRKDTTVNSVAELIELGKKYASLSKTKFDPKMYEEMFKLIENAGIKFKPTELSFQNTVYDINGNEVYGTGGEQGIFLSLDKSVESTVDPVKVILHEYVHTISLVQLGKDEAASDRLTKLMEDTEKKILESNDEMPADLAYAFTDIGEFMAEAISNPMLQEHMKTVTYANSQTTAFDKVMTIFNRLLKLDKKTVNALNETIGILIELNTENRGISIKEAVNENVIDKGALKATKEGLPEVEITDFEYQTIRVYNNIFKKDHADKIVEGKEFKYFPDTGIITVISPNNDNDVTKEEYEVYLAHEIKHALTHDWLHNPDNRETAKYLQDSLKTAYETMSNVPVIEMTYEQGLLYNRLKYAMEAGDSSIDEVVAILSSEPHIRKEFIKNFPQKRVKGKLIKILEEIAEHLGLGTDRLVQTVDAVVSQGQVKIIEYQATGVNDSIIELSKPLDSTKSGSKYFYDNFVTKAVIPTKSDIMSNNKAVEDTAKKIDSCRV